MPNIMKPDKDLSASYRTRLPKKEGERHRQAFFYYESLGPDRTHQKVAIQFKCSVDSVKVWSRTFQWNYRLAQREREERDQLIAEKRQEILDVRRGLINLGRLLIEDAIKRSVPLQESDMKELIEKGMIRIRTPKDVKDVKDFVLGAVTWNSSASSCDIPEAEDAGRQTPRIIIE